MRIVSWKVRGVGGEEKRRVVKELVRRCNVDILCLQMSNYKGDGDDIMRKMGRARLTKGVD